MTSFQEKVAQRLGDVGLSTPELADQVGMSEQAIRALCRAGNLRLFELEQLGAALRIDPSYFLHHPPGGSFNVTGYGSVQEIKFGKAAARELARHLVTLQRTLDMADALIASKNEIIQLLQTSISHVPS